MFASKPVNATLAVLALIGVAATVIAAAFGLGLLPPKAASAAPKLLPAGTLGVGAHMAAPLDQEVTASEKIEVSSDGTATALGAVAALRPVPLPAPRATARARTASAPAAPTGWRTARCSWYGPRFYGRRTASGAVLTTSMMNVAHKSLPFGTRIQFSYKGRSCIAVVNDRGPYVAGRTFDLGPGTARALGFSGVGIVSYRILGR